ncbi:MAG: type VI secretion system protein TssA [Gemmatimonadaceae bacterium]|nr:type VI secretion system protein TssA [Gemmatimonadaceae bacterium]
MPVNSELVARLLQPISSDAPAGVDLRYDPRVDAIKEARREDLDLPTNNAEAKRKLADWPSVVSLSTKLLSEETKDLQVAAWLAEGLLHREGYAGLATGLTVMRGLLDNFWETVFPLPEEDDYEVRSGPLEWIGAKLSIPLRMAPFGSSPVSFLAIETARGIPTEVEAEQNAVKADERAAALAQGKLAPEAIDAALAGLNKTATRATIGDLDALREAITSLDKSADVRFGSYAPSFIALRNVVDEIKRVAATHLAKKLEEDPDPEIVETVDDVSAAVGEDGAPISVEPTSRADAMNRLAVIARWLRAQDATNPAPYLLIRGLRWGELRASAPMLDPKLLEAPPTAIRSRLKTLLLDGKWPELLEQSEGLMALAAGRGWLDLQRYVLTACANLGGNYDAIAAAIRSELHALLVALPQLSRMTLMDDTPTANEETRAWLSAEGLPTPDEAAATDAMPDVIEADVAADSGAAVDLLADALEDDGAAAQQGGFSRARPIRRNTPRGRDAFDAACAELTQNRPHKAIELLMAELARDQSARGRMVRQTQIAYIMVEAGLDAVAEPILQRIIETIDERQLEQWESGPLVAQPMALMCRVLDRTGGDESTRSALYLRVCRLDPLQALSLQAR